MEFAPIFYPKSYVVIGASARAVELDTRHSTHNYYLNQPIQAYPRPEHAAKALANLLATTSATMQFHRQAQANGVYEIAMIKPPR